MKRIAINGFGRIGTAIFELILKEKDLELVAINGGDNIDNSIYTVLYDTVRGKFDGTIEKKNEKEITVNGKNIKWLSERDPSKLPWKDLNIDIVVECTGVFTSHEKSQAHIDAGAKKVVISAPSKDKEDAQMKADTILVGINDKKEITTDITSNASCTTNSIGIPITILNETVGVEKAILNTVHAYTSTQKIVDTKVKKNPRLGRAAAQNIIPSSTGAAKTTAKVIDSLKDKFDGISLRVPVISGSIADITFISSRNTTKEEINQIFKDAAKKECYKNLFTTTNEPIVSSDIIGSHYISTIDLDLTRVVDGNLVKVMSWYDNEMGYTYALLQHIKVIKI